MKKSTGILVAALMVAVLMANTVNAQIVSMEGKNGIIVKHAFYNNTNQHPSLKFAEQESMVIITKNGNITIDFVSWGKDTSQNTVLTRVSYQNQSTLVLLERGVWGRQVVNLKLAKNVSLIVGLTDLFWGSPTKFAKICTSLWVG